MRITKPALVIYLMADDGMVELAEAEPELEEDPRDKQ